MIEHDPQRGVVLGLVGPVCAGKSEAVRRFRELGAEVYEADAIVRGLYEQPDVKDAVGKLFGAAVFDADGSVNRALIASRIFGEDGNPDLRRRLTEEILFPRTGMVLQSTMARFRARARSGDVLVLDAPTLLEAGRGDWCDAILLVTAQVHRRREWAASRGWPPDELDRRDGAMLPESAKRRQARYVIENDGTPADLRAAVDQVWCAIRAESVQGTNGPS